MLLWRGERGEIVRVQKRRVLGGMVFECVCVCECVGVLKELI